MHVDAYDQVRRQRAPTPGGEGCVGGVGGVWGG